MTGQLHRRCIACLFEQDAELYRSSSWLKWAKRLPVLGAVLSKWSRELSFVLLYQQLRQYLYFCTSQPGVQRQRRAELCVCVSVFLCIYLSIYWATSTRSAVRFLFSLRFPPFKHPEKRGCVSLVVAKGSAFMLPGACCAKTWSDYSHCTDLVIFVKYSS